MTISTTRLTIVVGIALGLSMHLSAMAQQEKIELKENQGSNLRQGTRLLELKEWSTNRSVTDRVESGVSKCAEPDIVRLLQAAIRCPSAVYEPVPEIRKWSVSIFDMLSGL